MTTNRPRDFLVLSYEWLVFNHIVSNRVQSNDKNNCKIRYQKNVTSLSI